MHDAVAAIFCKNILLFILLYPWLYSKDWSYYFEREFAYFRRPFLLHSNKSCQSILEYGALLFCDNSDAGSESVGRIDKGRAA